MRHACRLSRMKNTTSVGPTDAALATRMQFQRMPTAWRAACKALCDDGLVVRQGVSLRLKEHQPVLSAPDALLPEQISLLLSRAGLRPPIVCELARDLDMNHATLVEFLERVSRMGHLVRVAKNRYFLPETLDKLAGIAAQLAVESPTGRFDAASFRDRSSIGRNLTIEVLEFMDQARITHFSGGSRKVFA